MIVRGMEAGYICRGKKLVSLALIVKDGECGLVSLGTNDGQF